MAAGRHLVRWRSAGWGGGCRYGQIDAPAGGCRQFAAPRPPLHFLSRVGTDPTISAHPSHQVGGELTDALLVLRDDDQLAACCAGTRLGLGGNLGLAVGLAGRRAEASVLVSGGQGRGGDDC